MKLDHECVRDLLLTIEDFEFNISKNFKEIMNMNRMTHYSSDPDQVVYTLLKLYEAGFINANVTYSSNSPIITVSSLSWDGHQFLDNIRDNKVWLETKEITSKFSSISLSMLSTVASTVISAMVKTKLGMQP